MHKVAEGIAAQKEATVIAVRAKEIKIFYSGGRDQKFDDAIEKFFIGMGCTFVGCGQNLETLERDIEYELAE